MLPIEIRGWFFLLFTFLAFSGLRGPLETYGGGLATGAKRSVLAERRWPTNWISQCPVSSIRPWRNAKRNSARASEQPSRRDTHGRCKRHPLLRRFCGFPQGNKGEPLQKYCLVALLAKYRYVAGVLQNGKEHGRSNDRHDDVCKMIANRGTVAESMPPRTTMLTKLWRQRGRYKR